jgi:hypothetical protein
MFDDIHFITDRRRLIKAAGIVGLTVTCLPLVLKISDVFSSAENKASESLDIRSSSGFVPHTHDLLIPFSILRAPPTQGVKLISTRALFHTHDIALTYVQLRIIENHGTVIAKGSSHLFEIALANSISITKVPSDTRFRTY